MLFYDYSTRLIENIPELNKTALQYIRWEYFIGETNKEVSFRLKLNIKNNNIRANRKKIVAFFQKEIPDLVSFYVENDELLDSAVAKSSAYIKSIDDKKYDLFFEHCSGYFLNLMPKQKLLTFFNKKQDDLGKLNKLDLLYRQHIIGIVNDKNQSLFSIVFKAEYSSGTVQEFITLGKDPVTEELKIYGYGTRPCDYMCQNLNTIK